MSGILYLLLLSPEYLQCCVRDAVPCRVLPGAGCAATSVVVMFRSTPPSRPNKVGLKMSVRPSLRPYASQSVRPQKVSLISLKFGM